MESLERVMQGLIKPINPYSTLILGVFTSAWGLWMISPFWSVFDNAGVYSKMVQFAPERAWGLWSFISGLVLVFAVFSSKFTCLYRALLFIGWHWSAVAIFMWWGDWQNTAGLTYTAVTLYTAYAYLNVKLNHTD